MQLLVWWTVLNLDHGWLNWKSLLYCWKQLVTLTRRNYLLCELQQRMMCRLCFNMCGQRHDYSRELYQKYKDTFVTYTKDKVECDHSSSLHFSSKMLSRRRQGSDTLLRQLLYATRIYTLQSRHCQPKFDWYSSIYCCVAKQICPRLSASSRQLQQIVRQQQSKRQSVLFTVSPRVC